MRNLKHKNTMITISFTDLFPPLSLALIAHTLSFPVLYLESRYQTLVKQLTSQGVYQMIKAKINEDVSISFKALVLPTANGEIAILQDRNCPSQTAYIVTLKTWKLRTLGKCPQFLTYPGFYDQLGIPVPGSDAIQLQIGGYFNLTCNAPGANAVVSLPQ